MDKPENTQGRNSARQWLPYCFFVIVFLALCLQRFLTLPPDQSILWDAQVYTKGLALWQAGADPYQVPANGLMFVYSPLFLQVAGFLSHLLPGKLAWTIYLTILGVITVSIPGVIAAAFIRSRWLTPVVAFVIFAFSPGAWARSVMLSGNISSLLYGLVLLASVPGLRRNRWLWFYLAVACSTILKPTFLLFLLLPLFIGKRQIWRSIACGSVALLVYASQRFTTPALYKAFQQAVYLQVVVHQDSGFGILYYGLMLDRRLPQLHGLIGPLVIGASLVAGFAALLYLRLRKDPAAASPYWPALLLAVAMLLNPHMQTYDADVMVVPAVYLAIEGARLIPASRFRNVGIALAVSIFATVLSRTTQPAVFMLQVGSVLLGMWAVAATGSRGSLLPATRTE